MKIGIQNFQGITDYQEIELAPLTLIYGPNSAGKSTLVDAMKVGADLYEKGPSAMPVEWIHAKTSTATPIRQQSETVLGFSGLTFGILDLIDANWTPSADLHMSKPRYPEVHSVISDELFENDASQVPFGVRLGWSILRGKLGISEFAVDLDGVWLFSWRADDAEPRNGIGRYNKRHRIMAALEEKLNIWGTSSLEFEHTEDEACFVDFLDGFKGSFVWLWRDAWEVEFEKEDPLVELSTTIVNLFVYLISRECNQDGVPPIRPVQVEPISLSKQKIESSADYRDPWREVANTVLEEYLSRDDLSRAGGLKALERFCADVDGKRSEALHKDYVSINEILLSPQFFDTGFTLTGDIQIVLDTQALERVFAAKESDRRAVLYDVAEFMITPKLHDHRRNMDVAIHDVGAGISQIIPVIVASRFPRAHIQQPELHLHPKMQARIADIFIQRMNTVVLRGEEHRYLLETHSELLVLRVLRRIRETCRADIKSKRFALTPDQVSVLYVDRSSQGVTTFKRLRISPEGEFLDRWPDGFFAERDAELFDDE